MKCTWDKVTDDNILLLHPKVRGSAYEFINFCTKKKGVNIRIYCSLRTFEEQKTLYNKGRVTEGPKVTNSKPGYSYHNYGLAFDCVQIKDGKPLWDNHRWDEIASIGRYNGWEWGGDFKNIVDKPHFQMSFGLNVKLLLKKHEEGLYEGGYLII